MFKISSPISLTSLNIALSGRLVRRTGTSLRELPPDVQSAELDENFPAERTAQVSTLTPASSPRYMPPAGTRFGPRRPGLAQEITDITNLIAQALSANNLFSSSPKSGLRSSRLQPAGRSCLGEFCLEFRSCKRDHPSLCNTRNTSALVFALVRNAIVRP